MMTALYLLISLSPLASISSLAKPFFQAAATECSGDCRLCGCSTERSASRTCCCWQKRVIEAKTRQQCTTDKSCPTAAVFPAATTSGECCSKPSPLDDHENEARLSVRAKFTADRDKPTVSISICPCGSGKDQAFSGDERSQHIPCRFLSGVPAQPITQFVFLQPERLASHSDEPPDPPPRIHILS